MARKKTQLQAQPPRKPNRRNSARAMIGTMEARATPVRPPSGADLVSGLLVFVGVLSGRGHDVSLFLWSSDFAARLTATRFSTHDSSNDQDSRCDAENSNDHDDQGRQVQVDGGDDAETVEQ